MQLAGTTNWASIGTGSTLIRSNVASIQNGDKYRVTVNSGGTCTAVVSNIVTLTVEGPVTVVTDVEDITACNGDAVDFSVNATVGQGTLTYQWESSTDAITWTDVSGETTDTLSLTADAATNNDTYYRVKMKTSECNEIISAAGKLYVEGLVTIAEQPIDQLYCENEIVIFSVLTLSDNDLINYLWQESSDNGINWNVVGNQSTLIKEADVEDNGNLYRVLISSGQCTAIVSDEVSLTIARIPIIEDDLNDVTVEVSDDAIFKANITNLDSSAELTWQVKENLENSIWEDLTNNSVYSGVDTETLEINEVTYDLHKNKYRLVIYIPGCHQRIISEFAILIVNLKIPNMFSPNGDGINETFIVPYLKDFPDFSMEIRDRWGNMVHEIKDDGNVNTEPDWWNGTSKGRLNFSSDDVLPAGTYFYVIEFNKPGYNPKTGWVYLRK